MLVPTTHSQQFLVNLKSSKRGAAAGPSGMTADHVMPLLETERDSVKLFALASPLRLHAAADTGFKGEFGFGRGSNLLPPNPKLVRGLGLPLSLLST